MTRDDIIKLARKAGLLNCDCCLPFWEEDDQKNWKRFFVNFAALVAAAEREACAKVCEEQGKGRKALEHYAALTYSGAAHDCAAAIRARGEKK